MKKIKILIITNELLTGGSEIVALNTARMLIKHGHHVDWICQGDKKELVIDHNINLYFKVAIKLGIKTKIIREIFLRRYILKLERKVGGYDLILSDFKTKRKFLPKSLLEKTYFYVHFDYGLDYFALQKKDKAKAAKFKQKIFDIYNGKNILAVSEGVKRSILNIFNVRPKKIVILYNFFDFDLLRKLANVPLTKKIKKPYVIHVSRFDPIIKRHDLLFEVFQKIPQPYHLVLLTQPSHQLSQLIKSYDLADRVTIAGIQKNPFNWIKQASVLVLCSDREGFGNVLVEALICGTPVVSTNCPCGPAEILTGSLSKYLVPCGDPISLKRKMLEVLKNKSEIPAEALERFSFETGYKIILSLIKK